jgi:hypothetical protein
MLLLIEKKILIGNLLLTVGAELIGSVEFPLIQKPFDDVCGAAPLRVCLRGRGDRVINAKTFLLVHRSTLECPKSSSGH